MELESDEERKYMAKLNRNIKESKKPVPKKKTKDEENNYQDLDHYFDEIVEQRIKDKEEEMKIKPMNFKK